MVLAGGFAVSRQTRDTVEEAFLRKSLRDRPPWWRLGPTLWGWRVQRAVRILCLSFASLQGHDTDISECSEQAAVAPSWQSIFFNVIVIYNVNLFISLAKLPVQYLELKDMLLNFGP